MELLDCIKFYLCSSPFHQNISHRSISAMCYVYHCSYETHDTYKQMTSGTTNYIFTVVMSVFASLF